jgi:hypothetical protein
METTITETSNETQYGVLTSYFRWSQEERTYQMNLKIDPKVEQEAWINVETHVYDTFNNPNKRTTIGEMARIFALQANDITRQRKATVDAKDHAQESIQTIGEALIEKAESMDWCGEFDEWVDIVNRRLAFGYELPTRIQEHEVEVEISGTVSVTKTFTVEARSQEHAEKLVADEPDSFFDPEEILQESSNFYVSDTSFEIQ